MFISFDGVDGGGKTTQIQLLQQYLIGQGHQVATFRDPGGTRLGESVREILLHCHDIPLAATAEMLLYMASRAQLVSEQIRPAIESGKVVISDRFLLANVVYQGHGGGLSPDELWNVGRVATGGLQPDMTFIFDLPVETAMLRVGKEQDRLERRGAEYFRKVRDGFLVEASKLQPHVAIVDATQSIDEIHAQICTFIQPLLVARGGC